MKSYPIDYELFRTSCALFIGHEQGLNGIGTLGEKNIHAILKYYFAPNPVYHEQKVGSFVADIMVDGEITEIQTRSFNVMRKKLDCFLAEHEVTIVYPVVRCKTLFWVDPETGETSGGRKSPKKGSAFSILPELYKIRPYLMNPHLHFILSIMDVQEYKLLNGYSKDKKHGASRLDGIPTDYCEEIHFDSLKDFLSLLPGELPDEFTTKDVSKAAKVNISYVQTLLLLLSENGFLERCGKKGNAILYRKVE